MSTKKKILLTILLMIAPLQAYALNFTGVELIKNTEHCGTYCEAIISINNPTASNITPTLRNKTLTYLNGKTTPYTYTYEVGHYENRTIYWNDTTCGANNTGNCTNPRNATTSVWVSTNTTFVPGTNYIHLYLHNKPNNDIVDWNIRVEYSTRTLDTKEYGWAIWGDSYDTNTNNSYLWHNITGWGTGKLTAPLDSTFGADTMAIDKRITYKNGQNFSAVINNSADAGTFSGICVHMGNETNAGTTTSTLGSGYCCVFRMESTYTGHVYGLNPGMAWMSGTSTAPTLNRFHNLKAQYNGSHLLCKTWPYGAAEPSAWNLTMAHTTARIWSNYDSIGIIREGAGSWKTEFMEMNYTGYTPPIAQSNITPVNGTTSDNLIGNCSYTGSQEYGVMYNWTWYKNGAVQTTGSTGYLMKETGFQNPGTIRNSSAFGTVEWNNTNNSKYQDNANSSLSLNGATSVILNATNYSFTIPTNATITGIGMIARQQAYVASKSRYINIKIHNATNGLIGMNESIQGWIATAASNSSMTGQTRDNWLANITPADTTQTNFGVGLSITKIDTTDPDTVAIDWIGLNIWHERLFGNTTKENVNNISSGSLTGGDTWVLECTTIDSTGTITSRSNYTTVITGGATTSCTYSGSGDWTIQLNDWCNITTTNDLFRNKLILKSGLLGTRLNITATGKIYNTSEILWNGTNTTIIGVLG